VRLRWGWITAVVAAVLFAAAGARAQRDVLTPVQSAAKAKQILHEAIQALGGEAYLNVRDQTCQGDVAFFGHHNELSDYERVWDFNLFPDKERTEYSKKRNIIDVYNGKEGWTLDRGGVSDMPAASIADFQKGLKRDINHLFRYQLKNPQLQFQYAGPDVVDLKQVDWVEVDEGDKLTVRIAVGQLTHLPIQAKYISRDPVTHDRTVEVEFFSNYQKVQGIQTPFQDTRTRDGRKIYQFFIRKCEYNTGLKPDFFTRQSLEQRWKKLGGKKKQKK
jgi:hypothetical protein